MADLFYALLWYGVPIFIFGAPLYMYFDGAPWVFFVFLYACALLMAYKVGQFKVERVLAERGVKDIPILSSPFMHLFASFKIKKKAD